MYIADYPEQLLVAGTKNGECPKCMISHNALGPIDEPMERHNITAVLQAFESAEHNPCGFLDACAVLKVKPINHPFFQSLPLLNIFQSLMPDILHQLYLGLVKHLLAWLKVAFGSAEIDARFQHIMPNHHVRLFKSGIFGISRMTSKEYDQICRVLLGIIVGMHLPSGVDSSHLT